MKTVNLTPHSVIFVSPKGEQVAIAPSGAIARVSMVENQLGICPVDLPDAPEGEAWSLNVATITTAPGDVIGLPAPTADTVFIVSALVRLAVPDRKDVASPARLVRDAKGAVIGCAALEFNP